MYCPICGKELNDDAQFCGHCGNKLSDAETIINARRELPKDIFKFLGLITLGATVVIVCIFLVYQLVFKDILSGVNKTINSNTSQLSAQNPLKNTTWHSFDDGSTAVAGLYVDETIDFGDSNFVNSVQGSIMGFGTSSMREGTYTVSGDTVTLRMANGENRSLKLVGNALVDNTSKIVFRRMQ
jgi:hypothetical protein